MQLLTINGHHFLAKRPVIASSRTNADKIARYQDDPCNMGVLSDQLILVPLDHSSEQLLHTADRKRVDIVYFIRQYDAAPDEVHLELLDTEIAGQKWKFVDPYVGQNLDSALDTLIDFINLGDEYSRILKKEYLKERLRKED